MMMMNTCCVDALTGMLIELMAGKAAAVKACCYDATPFSFTEDDDPITYFGHCLRKGLSAQMTVNETVAQQI